MERGMEEEKKIIDRVQSGDQLAFKQIVELNKKMVYYLAYDLTGNHQDAEDLSQEVFIKMFKSISKFRGEAKLSTWLKKITVNLYIDMKRSKLYKSFNMQYPIEDKEFEINSNQSLSNPDNNMDIKMLSAKVEFSLHKLSPKEKSIFIMRHFQEMTIAEISDSMNIAVGTVKSLLFRAVQKLQQNLAPYRREFGLEDS
jgi:RNA polymerase sigma-70 factor (ECF subfamily)